MAVILFVGTSISISPLIPYIFSFKGNILSIAACALYLTLVLRLQIGTQAIILMIILLLTLIAFNALSFYIPIHILQILGVFVAYVAIRAVANLNYINIIRNAFYLACIRVCAVASKITLNYNVFLLVLITFSFALVNSFYWGNFTARILIYFFLAIFVASYTDKYLVIRFIQFTSCAHYWMLFFAVCGFVYAFLGGDSLFSIANEDGRENGFYLTTFSNTYLFGFIRPSGIYDEPGALSFYVCIIVALREVFYLNRKLSWKLLVLGFITGSLAHFIFVFLFAIHSGYFKISKFFRVVPVVIAILGVVYITDSPFTALLVNLFSRFEIRGGTIAGDNRSILFINALSYLDSFVVLFGLNGSCILNLPECIPVQYEQYGENPLTLMVHLGLTLSWLYYAALIFLLIKSRSENRYVVLGVLMLLLQRPYLLSFGYTIIIVLFIYSLHYQKEFTIKYMTHG